MSQEFYREPDKHGFGRYAVWVIVIFFAGVGFFHLFTEGAENFVSFVKKKADIYLSQPEDVYAKESDLVVNPNNTDLNSILEIHDSPFSKNKIGEQYGQGLTMFRGNPSRSWYGSGPMPENPEIKWRYPEKSMCSESVDKGETKIWCGSGWTGQPVVWDRPDGKTEIIFGAYDKSVHFVDANTGKDLRTPFPTGDIIKGSVTLDPDGFPLLYFGSRDNKLRILSLEDDTPTELWSLDSKDLPGIWNDDWDSNPVIMNDILFTGGENGWFFAVKLNRARDADGKISVAPKIIFTSASYDDEFLAKLGDKNASIENSVTIYKDTAYFANSGGRVMGLDIKNIESGVAPTVFDYWVGDDVDATIVIDSEGSLYVVSEEERLNDRSKEIGQIIKLDPNQKDPLVWSVKIPSTMENIPGGIWATPALYKDNLYVATNPGKLIVVDTKTGQTLWSDEIGAHAWSSPIISEKELLVTTCTGKILKYSLENPDQPMKKFEFQMPGGSCLESTPALWEGSLYFGSRDGFFYKIGEK